MAEPKILVVDDTPANIKVLDAVLFPRGYQVVSATNGQEGLDAVAREQPDLILADVVMPVMDGYELCRRLRQDEASRALPIIMITASGEQEKIKALEAGADDFVLKPFDHAELLARVKSLLRIKQYQDELANLNRTLEARVAEQVSELERLSQLRRFLSPQLAELVVNSPEGLLESHRRQIAVAFVDLRTFTSFSETAEPEELMEVLAQYHQALGAQVHHYDGTVGFFAGDGLMVFFNDPMPCEDPAVRAVRMAAAMREDMDRLTALWQKRGIDLGFGAGVAIGYATLGRIGFEGRYDYTAIGSVVNQAARLCAHAMTRQIIISQRVLADVDELVECEPVGDVELKGFHKPVAAYNVVSLKG